MLIATCRCALKLEIKAAQKNEPNWCADEQLWQWTQTRNQGARQPGCEKGNNPNRYMPKEHCEQISCLHRAAPSHDKIPEWKANYEA
jgi:hypothetical protein